MRLVLDHLGRTLIDAAIANAVLLSLVVVVMVFTRQPARRIMLAQAAFYAALFMLPLVVFTPLPRFYPIDWMTSRGLVPPQLRPRWSQYATGDLLGKRLRARLDDVGRGGHADVEWPAGEPLIRGLTLLHLAGASIGIAWFSLGVWGFQRLLRRSHPPSGATRRTFDELIVDLGRPPPHPNLRVTTRLRGPVLGGLIQPCILIPERLDDENVDPDLVRLILLHELAHADRSDVWFGALAGLSQAVWFFMPHLWWLRSQLRLDQEFLADRKAAGPIGDSTAYARWLVGLASARSSDDAVVRPPPEGDDGAPAVRWWKGGFKSPLLQRVAMLLHCPFLVEEHPPTWFAIVMPALLMSVAIALSTCRLLAPFDPAALVQRARAVDPVSSTFHVPQFVVVPNGGTAVLPLALPPLFRLTAELNATPGALAEIRLAGYPLGAPDADASDDTQTWHSIFITRDEVRLIVRIDGEVVMMDEHPYRTGPDSPQWLTIQPPRDETVTFKDLLVNWW